MTQQQVTASTVSARSGYNALTHVDKPAWVLELIEAYGAIISTSEACTILGCSRRTFRRIRGEGVVCISEAGGRGREKTWLRDDVIMARWHQVPGLDNSEPGVNIDLEAFRRRVAEIKRQARGA